MVFYVESQKDKSVPVRRCETMVANKTVRLGERHTGYKHRSLRTASLSSCLAVLVAMPSMHSLAEEFSTSAFVSMKRWE